MWVYRIQLFYTRANTYSLRSCVCIRMVLEAVKTRVFDYLHSKGLTKEDIGKVVGIFFFAKYLTFLSMIPICYKFQPLRRLLKPPGRIGVHMNTVLASRASYRAWMKKHGFDEKLRQAKLARAKTLSAVKEKLRAQRLLWLSRQKKKSMDNPTNWKSKIFAWTERIAEKAENNEKWKTIAHSLKVPPKLLAYAIGEGLVVYKLTSPIWMPIELMCIVKYLQARNAKNATHTSEASV